jgi:hypothetical protein
MAEVTVECRIPVYVVVDTETGEVVRVVADDGALSEPVAFWTEGGDEISADAADALAAAAGVDDGEQVWPSWDFGW